MKRILLLSIAFLLFGVSLASAAGTCTQQVNLFKNPNFAMLQFVCTADSAAATYPSTTLTNDNLVKIGGFYITEVRTYPGGTAPTNNFGITISDAGGLDMMTGNLANRSSSAPARAYPTMICPPIADALVLAITGNAVNSAVVTINIYLAK